MEFKLIPEFSMNPMGEDKIIINPAIRSPLINSSPHTDKKTKNAPQD